jgi:hypothetical protein
MKLHILCCFLSMSLISTEVYAQDERHEISLSCGIKSSAILHDDGTVRQAFPSTAITLNTGSLFITCRHSPTPGVGIGIAAGIQSYEVRYPYPTTGFAKVTVRAIAAELKLTYFGRDKLQLYGFLGTGLKYYRSTQSSYTGFYSGEGFSKAILCGQVTPLGISYGARLAVFAEAGYGYKGLANFGVCYRFGAPAPFVRSASGQGREISMPQ